MKNKKLVSNTLSAGVIFFFSYYVSKHISEFKNLLDLEIIPLGLVFLGYIASIYASGLFNKIVIEPFGKHITTIESFKVALISSIGNYFGPLLGGAGLRAVYLKKKTGLTLKQFMATLYGYYLISFLISAALGLVALGLLHAKLDERGFFVLVIFFLCIVTSILMLMFGKKIISVIKLENDFLKKKFKIINKIMDSWRPIARQPKLLFSLTKITGINIALFVVINYCEFLLIGVHLSLGSVLLYTCLGIFSVLISITPGALGIREAVFIFSASVIGVSSTEIIAVAVIDRAVQFIVMTLGWLLITFVIPKRIDTSIGSDKRIG